MKNIKHIPFFVATLLVFNILSGSLHSQDSIRTLFKPAKIHSFGIYIAPEFQYGQMDNAFTAFSGGSAMLLFNRRLAVGVTGQHNMDRNFSPSNVSPLVVRSAFGGGKVEYTLRPDKAVHISFPLVIGMGMARADSVRTRLPEPVHGHNNGGFNGRNQHGPDYWVIQPGVQLEANVLRNVQVFAGVNYRISSNTRNNNTTLPNDVLQGVAISAGVKLGFFNLLSSQPRRTHTPTPEVFHSFMEQFPAGTDHVKWHKEHHGAWEAEFQQNGVETSANFAPTGQWLETETKITRAALPATLQTAVKDVKIREITRIQKADSKILYELEVKGKDLIFDEQGMMIFQ